MDPARFTRVDATTWCLEPHGAMHVPAVILADETLLSAMDGKVGEQLANVASLSGIVDAAYALPDAHWGYGFPIGGSDGGGRARFFPGGGLRLLFDVSHNTCKVERHPTGADGRLRELHVHRKGATRALDPGDPSLPEALRP